MLIGPTLRVAAAAILGVAVAGSFAVTGYLARLERGIGHNVTAARAVLTAQQVILDRNAALREMAEVTGRIGGGLEGLLATSGDISRQIGVMEEANRSTLALNEAMEGNNAASARDLRRVVAALKEMNQSAAGIRDSLAALASTARADVDYLEAIRVNTARMNKATPELVSQ